MIPEFIIDTLFNFLSGLFSLLPDVSWDVSSGAMGVFLNIVRVVGYLLPGGTVAAIIGLIVAFNVFRVVISLIKTILELIPFV